MTVHVYGNSLLFEFEANEPISPITLPNGYSYERINITESTNIYAVNQNASNRILTFPPVNSKSPSIIIIGRVDAKQISRLRFSIEKFGQIPDAHYFDKAFDPILVTGDDGKEYNVIPSDQFK